MNLPPYEVFPPDTNLTSGPVFGGQVNPNVSVGIRFRSVSPNTYVCDTLEVVQCMGLVNTNLCFYYCWRCLYVVPLYTDLRLQLQRLVRCMATPTYG